MGRMPVLVLAAALKSAPQTLRVLQSEIHFSLDAVPLNIADCVCPG